MTQEEQIQSLTTDILYYRRIQKENIKLFYRMEMYDDLALCEFALKGLGINPDTLQDSK